MKTRRIISFILALILVTALLPTAALATGTDKAIRLVTDGDTLYVFNEQYNGDYMTDYAGAFAVTINPTTLEVVGVTEWNDAGNESERPENFTVRLLADGAEKASQEVSEGEYGIWAFSFDSLPIRDAHGQEIAYSVTADEIPGYTTVVENAGDNAFRIVNTAGTAVTEVSTWAELQAAVSSARAGDTVILRKDVTSSDTLQISKALTLDLGGKTLSYSGDDAIAVADGGALTVTDSGGSGKIISTHQGCSGIEIKAGGTATIEAGTIQCDALYGSGITNRGTLTVNGGTMTGGSMGYGIFSTDTLYVYGGTISSQGSGLTVSQGAAIVGRLGEDNSAIRIEGTNRGIGGSVSKANVTVYGGSVTCGGGSGSVDVAYCDVTIYGGKFNGALSTRTGGHIVIKAPESGAAPIFSGSTAAISAFCVDCNPVANPDGVTSADYPTTVVPVVLPTEVSTWDELQAALSAGGDILLTADVIPDNPYWANPLDVPSGVTAKLDLNGHIVDRGYNADMTDLYGSVFKIFGTLTVTDSAPDADHGGAVAYTDPVTGDTVEVTGGVITGGFYEQSGGGVRILGGTFNLEGGSITGNGAGKNGFGAVNGLGGGVYMQSGTFNMSGGAVVGNRAVNKNTMVTDMLGKGGGVYVNGGTFTMSGGTVSGNEAGRCGGGVYLASEYSGHSGSLVSGGATVTGNAVGGADNNVYLEDGGVLSVSDTLTGTVGVTMMTPGVFTSGLSGRGTADNFVSDDADYIVSLTDAGEAQLKVEEYPLWVGGVQVTSVNKGDITAAITAAGGTASGAASYDPDTNTLTLTGFQYSGAGYEYSGNYHTALYYNGADDLVIRFSGENRLERTGSVTGYSYGMCFEYTNYENHPTVTFRGSDGDSLTVKGGVSTGEFSTAINTHWVDLTFSGGEVNAVAENGKAYSYGVSADNAALTVSDGNLNAAGGTATLYDSQGIYSNWGTINVAGGTLTAVGGDGNRDSQGIFGATISVSGVMLVAQGKTHALQKVSLSLEDGVTAQGSTRFDGENPVTYASADNDSYKWFRAEKPTTYTVTVTPGANMMMTAGANEQTVRAGDEMKRVIYMASEGYYFPDDYAAASVNGVTVMWDSFTRITVFGTPTADANITLTAPTAQTREETPNVTFTATGYDTGTLTGVAAGMKYKIGGGEWQTVSGTSVDLTNLAPCTVKIYMPGNGTTTVDSDEQTITVTKAEAPALTAAQLTSVGGKGSIPTTAEHEFSTDGTTWTACTGETTGLVPDTYYVRVKAADTVMASDAQEIVIIAPGSVAFSGRVTLNGRPMTAGDTFTFEVSANGTVIATAQSDATGNIYFTEINYLFSDVGQHTYTVKQSATTLPGVAIDGREYTVNVTVSYTPGDAALTVTPSEEFSGLYFTNTYDKQTPPEYSVPTGLEAIYGQTLADVTLPDGWAWDDALTTKVGNVGDNTFSATYTPDDTTLYKTVTATLTIAVSQATPDFTPPDGLTAVYGQTLADVTLPNGWAWDDALTTKVGNVGDNTFSAAFTPEDTLNYKTVTATLTIAVSQATPDCTPPDGLTAVYGQTLADVTLPDGWAWDDPLTTKVGNVGNNTFSATFTPADAVNFRTVTENVTVAVSKAGSSSADLKDDEKPKAAENLIEDVFEQALVMPPVKLPEGYTGIEYSTDGENWSDTVPTGKKAGEYTVQIKYIGDANHEDFAGDPVTVSIGKAVYAFSLAEGEGLTYKKGSGKELTATVVQVGAEDTSFEHFAGVYIGEAELQKDVDYTVRKGSTVVTLLPAALERQNVGTYTLTVRFTNGEASARFTVLAADVAEPVPQTGHDSRIGLWIILMTVSAVSAVSLLVTGKKKRVFGK